MSVDQDDRGAATTPASWEAESIATVLEVFAALFAHLRPTDHDAARWVLEQMTDVMAAKTYRVGLLREAADAALAAAHCHLATINPQEALHGVR